jgi:hypothetical protein
MLKSIGSCVLPTEDFNDAVLDPATRLGFYVSENNQISCWSRKNHGRTNKPIRIAKSDTGIHFAGVISDIRTSEEPP